MVTCDDLYELAGTIEDVYAAIVERLVAYETRLVRRARFAAYRGAHRRTAARRRTTVELVVHPALSFLDLAWERLGVDPFADGVRLVDGHDFAAAAGPLLVGQCDTKRVLSDIKLSVDEGPDVIVLQRLGLPEESISTVAWADLDRAVTPDHLTSLWIPWMPAPLHELEAFVELVRLAARAMPVGRGADASSR